MSTNNKSTKLQKEDVIVAKFNNNGIDIQFTRNGLNLDECKFFFSLDKDTLPLLGNISSIIKMIAKSVNLNYELIKKDKNILAFQLI